jgi:phosphogluconate dehydratase
LQLIKNKSFDTTIASIVSEKTIVNGIIGLLASGGSTNHTIHLIAIARAAGIIINWDDFSDLSKVIPLLARVYPNGAADVNHFHAAGGIGFVVKTLLESELIHNDVYTILGFGLEKYTRDPKWMDGKINWVAGPENSLNDSILRPVSNPFHAEGGIRMLAGNIGRAVIKTSAVAEEHFVIEAPAIVFDEQEDLIKAFKKGELDKDFIAVIPFQGPKQNGMPELHQLTPTLTILQKRGFKVALITTLDVNPMNWLTELVVESTIELTFKLSKLESIDEVDTLLDETLQLANRIININVVKDFNIFTLKSPHKDYTIKQ